MRFTSIRKNFLPPNFLFAWWEGDITGQVTIPDSGVNTIDLSVAPPSGLCNGVTDGTAPGGSRQIINVQNPNRRASHSPASPPTPDWDAGVTFLAWYRYGNNTNDFTQIMSYANFAASSGASGIELEHSGGRKPQAVVRNNGSVIANIVPSGSLMSPNQWVMVAAVFEGISNGDSVHIYRDGTNKASSTLSADWVAQGSERWAIGGRYNGGSDDGFQRTLGAFRLSVISRALSDAEVTSCYNSGTPLDQAGIAAIANDV